MNTENATPKTWYVGKTEPYGSPSRTDGLVTINGPYGFIGWVTPENAALIAKAKVNAVLVGKMLTALRKGKFNTETLKAVIVSKEMQKELQEEIDLMEGLIQKAQEAAQ